MANTPADLASIGIVNGALRLLNQDHVSTVEESNTARQVWSVAQELAAMSFASQNWRFATRVVKLEPNLDEAGVALQSPYQPDWVIYKIPVGAVRVRDVFQQYYSSDYPIEARVDRDGIHTFAYDEVEAAVIYPLKVEDWPVEFARAIQAAAAFELGPRLAADLLPVLQKEKEDREREALQSDARDGSKKRRLLNPDGYATARTGAGFGLTDDLRYGARFGRGY